MYTNGNWKFNKENCTIESDSEYLIESELDEEGIPMTIIDCYGAMGGLDSDANIRLICAAPNMFELLKEIKSNCNIDNILLSKINEIINNVDIK